jgi:Coenzyme PQQ synthesis protein D (PqqD)
MAEIRLDSVVVVSKQQVSCDLADEAAILHLKTATYYGLNPVGATVWRLLHEPRRVRELKDLILAEYDVQAQTCESDLLRLLGELDREGLLEVRN